MNVLYLKVMLGEKALCALFRERIKRESPYYNIMGDGSFTDSERKKIDDYDIRKRRMLTLYGKASFAIASVSLALFLVLATGMLVGLSERVHGGLFSRLGIEIESDFAKEQTDPHVINNHIMQYFGSKEDMIQVNYFEQDEKSHLRDVKELLSRAKLLTMIFLALAIIMMIMMYLFMRTAGHDSIELSLSLLRIVQYASLAAIALWIIIFLAYIPVSSEGFDGAFIRMHEQLFPQGNWQFPQESLLIRAYPQVFFHSLGLTIVRYSLLIITIIFILSTIGIMAFHDKKR